MPSWNTRRLSALCPDIDPYFQRQRARRDYRSVAASSSLPHPQLLAECFEIQLRLFDLREHLDQVLDAKKGQLVGIERRFPVTLLNRTRAEGVVSARSEISKRDSAWRVCDGAIEATQSRGMISSKSRM